MKKKIISFCVATILAVTQGYAGVTITVPEVNIAQGGTSYIIINYNLGTTAYTAYQFEIAYPEGISSVNGSDGNPSFIKGEVYDEKHNVSSSITTEGKSLFQCFSIDSNPFTAQSGTLLMLPIKAQKSLALGTYQATISPIEFVQTDATPDRPEAITFNITVTNTVVLDELSPVPPASGTGVNVKVKRSINANEWSTICLPFAMSETQTKAAFGNDVEIADFTGTEPISDGDDVVGIIVNFDDVTAIEANRPYIIKVSTPLTEFTINNVDIVANEDEAYFEFDNGRTGTRRIVYSGFYGTYHAGTVLDQFTLFLNENKFWYSAGLTKMKAFRGYFNFYDVLTEVENASSRIIMSFGDEGTGIMDFDNGQWTTDDKLFDLQGRRVVSPAKGIYIKNGKKVKK